MSKEQEEFMICAKAIGANCFDNTGTVFIYYDQEERCIEYNPLTNDAQAYELEGYLLDNGWVIDKQGHLYYACHPELGCYMDESLNEAIINAVCAMEDTHERV